ncbi:MAG: PAS domain S-box protein, partial [Marinoscillum sp.]
VIFNLYIEQCQELIERCAERGLEYTLVDAEMEINESRLYIVKSHLQFNFDGKRIHFKSTQPVANAYLEVLTQHYPQGTITLLDKQLNIIYTSGEAYQTHKMDAKSLNGLPLKSVVISEVYNLISNRITTLSKGQSFNYEIPYEDRYYRATFSYLDTKETTDEFYLLRVLDVSEKRAADISLLESEERFRYYHDQSQEIICTHDSAGVYKIVSPSVKRLMGYESEEMVGQHPYDYVHPDDKTIIRNSWKKILEGKVPENIQYRARRKDGSYIWLDSYAAPVTDSKGRVTSITSGSRDITELKEFEIKLRESEKRFRGIADNLPGVVYLCLNDESYTMLFLNDNVKDLTGYDKSKFLEGAISVVDLYHPDDKEKIFAEVDEALEKQVAFHLTYRLKNVETNQWTWVEEFGQGIFENGELVSLEGVIIDVTQRFLDQRQILQSQANLKALIESTTSLIGLFDTDKRLIEFNSSLKNYVLAADGIEVVKGMHISELVEPSKVEEFERLMDHALQGEKVKLTSEYPTDLGVLYFQSSHNPIYSNGEITGVSLFIEDVTELRESQNQLEKYTEDLEMTVANRTRELKLKNQALSSGNKELEVALSELKSAQTRLVQSEKMASLGVLAAGIGHEINNPLNFIQNGSSGLKRTLQDLQRLDWEAIDPFFEIIEEGVYRAGSIVKSLSHFSRQVKSMDESCNVHDVIDNCLVILNANLKGRIVVIKGYEDTGVILKGNEGKLHQIFLNILTNAEQAIETVGEISIESTLKDDLLTIEIADDGVGIPEENLSKIGDPFFTTKPPGLGTGLGLFITYSLIKELNGDITVESTPKIGTKFIITFPIG